MPRGMGGEHILAALSSLPLLPFEASLLFSDSFYFQMLFWLAVLASLSDSWDPGFFELQEILAVILSLSFFFYIKKVSSSVCL